MRGRLFLRLIPHQPDNVEWLRVDADPPPASLSVQRGAWSEVAPLAHTHHVVLLVPGVDVTLAHARVPGKNRSRIASAVPYVLEEQLAGDVEQLHFALGERSGEGLIATAAVARAQMDAWLAPLHDAGISAAACVPETLCVPQGSGNEWTVLQDQHTILVRTGRDSGYATDAENFELMLRLAITETDPQRPDQIRIIYCAEYPDGWEPVLPNLTDLEMQVHTEWAAEPALAVLARGYQEQTTINLLQGAYSRNEQIGKLWRPWRAAAALLVAWVLLQSGMTITHYWQLKNQNLALTQQIEKTYLQAFPEAKRVVDAKAQMEQKLAELRGGGGGAAQTEFLTLLSSIGPRVQAINGAQIQRLGYKDNAVDLVLTLNALQDVDHLKQQLGGTSGLAVEIQSATNRDGKVEARLQIKGRGA